jgi:hypothetical protein
MKRMCFFLILALFLGGCSHTEKTPTYRVVTGVDVEYHQQDNSIFRTYHNTTSVESILTYIRILDAHGPVLPEGESHTTCKITLHYSSGPDCVYIQRGSRYLQKDGGDWETVDTSRASLLYPLLLLLPSDG